MSNIIVFGGAGFIGTNLIKYLLNESNNIICIDNLSTGRQKNVNIFINNPNYTFILGDITDDNVYDKIINTYENIDEIYNLACPASPPKYLKDPIHTLFTSISIYKICKLCLKYNAKLLHASTSEVYGDPDNLHHPQKESYYGNVNIIGPRSCYDEGKRIAETFLYEYNKLGLKCKIIRIFNTYGPYMDPDDGRVISNFICQALSNQNITIYGNGSQTRSFQYIDDLIYGMVNIMKLPDDIIGPINVGNPEEFTIKELSNLVLKMIPNSKSKIEYKDFPKNDPLQRKADISYAYELFNYNPKIKLSEGLKKTIEYFKKELNII